MRTAQIKVFAFSELKPKAKQKAIGQIIGQDLIAGWDRGIHATMKKAIAEAGYEHVSLFHKGIGDSDGSVWFDAYGDLPVLLRNWFETRPDLARHRARLSRALEAVGEIWIEHDRIHDSLHWYRQGETGGNGILRTCGKSRILLAWVEFVEHVTCGYFGLCSTAHAAFKQAYADAVSPENISALCEEWNMEFHEDGREFEPNEEIAA
jgi:hypothetical protein